MEIWKPTHILGECYSVSNFGNVRRDKYGRNAKVGQNRKPHIDDHGYYSINLTYGKFAKSMRVHKLVATAFLGECPEGHEVNHIDGNKLNNNLSNLEYVTYAQNTIHACRLGFLKPFLGEAHGRAKLTSQDVLEMRNLHASQKITRRELSEKFKISKTVVTYILHRKLWKHI